MSVESFIRELNNLMFENTFNPYSEHCKVFDVHDAPRKRSLLLERILIAACETDIDSIWVGRDLGYRGGRRTGLALTDDIHLHHHVARWGIEIDQLKLTKGQAISERTTAIIWSVLEQITNPIFLWNVFPLHPYEKGDQFTNRAHNASERAVGEELLGKLVELLKPKRIVAIGNDAEKAVNRFKGSYEVFKVRHPSYGGKNIFINQINSIYNIDTPYWI